MKRILLVTVVALLSLLGVIGVRTAMFPVKTITRPGPALSPVPDQNAALERFSKALQFQTVSNESAAADDAAFAALHAHLEASFPLVHSKLKREQFGKHALLFTWEGVSSAKPAVLLMAHQDVVPVEPGTEASWTHPPFSGARAEGFVWGRGAMDDKGALMAQLEAAEWLLREDFRPMRTIVFAFGDDEEVGGEHGAAELAKALEGRGQKFDFLLDEGHAITKGIVPGISGEVASIGIAERGVVNLELTADSPGGHGAMPPPQTAAGIIAAAVARVEANPLDTRITAPALAFFDAIGGRMPLPQRAVFANLWLFSPVLRSQLSHKPGTNAVVRTTIAATMLEGSVKANVLPQRARAVLNVRLLPGDTIASVTDHVKNAIADPRVKVTALGGLNHEASSVSSVDSRGYHAIESALIDTYPDAVIAPNLTVGATDAPHYAKLATDAYRHLPYVLGPEDLARLHGTNERLPEATYLKAIQFYRQVIRLSAND